MPSPCLSCHLLKHSKDNPTCRSCQKRIDRIREINLKYPTGPIVDADHQPFRLSDVYERTKHAMG